MAAGQIETLNSQALRERYALDMTPFTAPITFRGRHASLEPLCAAHHDDLGEATRDGELWKLWSTAVPSP